MKFLKHLLICLLALFSLELVFRIYYGNRLPQIQSCRLYPYGGAGDFLPNRDYIEVSKQKIPFNIRINQLGLRSNREYPLQKPAGVFRVIALGDSFTFGVHVNTQDTWPARLEEQLVESGISAEVFNAGVQGYTLADEYELLRDKGINFKPDLVLVAFYGNDILDFHPLLRNRSLRDFVNFPGKTKYWMRQWAVESALVSYLLALKYYLVSRHQAQADPLAEAILVRNDESVLPPAERAAYLEKYLAYLKQVVELSRRQGFRVAWVFMPPYTDIAEESAINLAHKQAIKRELDQQGIPYLDLLPDLRASGKEKELYLLPEEWHMSRFGYQVCTNSIQRFVEKKFGKELSVFRKK